jgi:hypothetical protein
VASVQRWRWVVVVVVGVDAWGMANETRVLLPRCRRVFLLAEKEGRAQTRARPLLRNLTSLVSSTQLPRRCGGAPWPVDHCRFSFFGFCFR